MSDRLIVDQDEFEELCEHIRNSKIVAFDSEFVSEYTYRPELCLLQFATAERCVAVDPYQVTNLDGWWNVMTDEETTVVVHGGQAEIRFCLEYVDRKPCNLVDIQLAEGLRSRSYPLGYSDLVRRVLGQRIHGKETRTDWRRRPLSDQQIHYALEDVKHVIPIWERQRDSLKSQNRLEWVHAEFQGMIDDIVVERSRDGWQRVSGTHRLSRRELAVAHELCQWRENEADRRNRPLRRILRDDLIVDLARRQPKNKKELLATRDMNRPEFKRPSDELLECVVRGLAVPESELPERPESARQEKHQDEHVLGKLLAIALANRCAEVNVAKPLVGTSADLRHLVRWHVLGDRTGSPPRLANGWRSEVCGDLLTDLLDGKTSLRVADPQSDHPLVFQNVDPA